MYHPLHSFSKNTFTLNPRFENQYAQKLGDLSGPLPAERWGSLTLLLLFPIKKIQLNKSQIFLRLNQGILGSNLEGGIQDHSPYFEVSISVQLGSDLNILRVTLGKRKKSV